MCVFLITNIGISVFTNYDESINTYGYTVSAEWEYTRERPYKGDVIKGKRRIYIHYYYSIDKGAEDEQAFDKRIAEFCSELLDKLDVIECFEDKNRKLRIGELLNKQAEIYEALGVALPTSSC